MTELPDRINDVEHLEELLSRPSKSLVEFMRDLEGDIMVVGAGGKMGPTLTTMAKRAIEAAGVKKDVFAIARRPLPRMEAKGVKTLVYDMLNLEAVQNLPQVRNIIFMVGRKFGSTGNEPLTWATNTLPAYHTARTFPDSNIVAFSTGCVYPILHMSSGGATEETPVAPIGEYSMSCLARERMFDYYSENHGLKVAHIRLSYAMECRYGVLVDVATRVWNDEPIDVTTGYANVIWQGDACEQAIRSLALAGSPATILNVTGPDTICIRLVASEFGRLLDKNVQFVGQENGRGYLINAAKANSIFGNPSVPVGKMIQWIADWVKRGGESLKKPTHFEVQDGRF
jgi:nucleoside-diphosphate-sugar epimerase